MCKNIVYIIFIFFASIVAAQEIPQKPGFFTPVYDEASLLTVSQREYLTNKLIKFEDSTSTQIQIVLIQSLKGFSEIDYANKWANQWGIGQKGKDNGLLIFIAKADRKIRIEVGYGLEDKISDAVAADIIDNTIKPNFKNTDYFTGLDQAVSKIELYLSGKYVNVQNNVEYKNENVYNYPERAWYQIGYEGFFNICCMLVALIIFNYQVYRKFKKNEENSTLKRLISYLFGNAAILGYAIIYGIDVDPETPDLLFHFIVGIFPTILVIYHDKLFKTKKEAYIKIGIFLAVWIFFIFLLTFVIGDKIKNVKTFIPFLLMGLFCIFLLFVVYFFITSLKYMISSSSTGGSSSYSSSYRSSTYSSSSSSYKSSSYGSGSSKSSYGGGKFGGGGASGSW